MFGWAYNSVHGYTYTGLIRAAKNDDFRKVKKILSYLEDTQRREAVMQHDKHGYSALMYAAEQGKTKTFNMLYDAVKPSPEFEQMHKEFLEYNFETVQLPEENTNSLKKKRLTAT